MNFLCLQIFNFFIYRYFISSTSNIQENRIRRLPDGALPMLHHIELAENDLIEFPRILLSGTTLRVIVLEGNAIPRIPQGTLTIGSINDLEIKTISNLRGLNLAKNQLSEIPDELCQLPHLQYLKLSKNNIIQLPEQIGNLTKYKNFINNITLQSCSI